MAYSNSSLVSYTKISPNRNSPRNHAIDTITIHCVVGQCSVETLGNIFAPSSRQASSNYGVGYDGRIGMYVEEKDRSWCSSSAVNDNRAVTIEVASDTTHPYAVNAKAYAAMLDLVTDICKRNGIKKLVWSTNKNERVNHLNGCNMTVHRDYANKSCPGDYLYNRHGEIAAEVNKRLGATTGSGTSGGTTTATFEANDVVRITGSTYYNGKSIPAWVKAKNWIVHSAGGDRVVLNKSEDGVNAIMSPFRASDLTLVKAAKAPTPVAVTGTVSTGSDADKKTFHDFFIGKLNNEFGVAGLWGNIFAESGGRSNNLQNAYETKLGYTDDTYTAAVDNGSYTNFVKDSAGYGLAQWTYYTRKQALLDYAKNAKKSVGDYATQLAFLYKELSENYATVLNTLKGAKTVKEASDAVLTQFERPADMSDAAKTKRAGYGQEFYNKFVTTGTGTGGNEEPATPGCYASTVIAVAQNELGYYEKASNSNLDDKTANKGSANYTKYARDFDQKYPNWYNGKKNGYAWCDMFVDWCFLTAFGYEKALYLLCQPEKSAGAGCTYSLRYYKAKGQFYTSNPKAGDQIFFGTSVDNSSHTGLVEKVEGGKVYTIEGNTSDMVARRTYALGASNIVGYGRPNYDGAGSVVATEPSTGGSTHSVLCKGSTGDEVKELQQKLTTLGYSLGAIDGDFGDKTLAAVKKFQKDYSLDVDGVVGNQTWTALDKAVAAKSSVPYVVRVTTDALNIRKGAGTNYAVVGCIRDKGAYTIVEEKAGTGASKWGLLKAYASSKNGWISLDYVKKV